MAKKQKPHYKVFDELIKEGLITEEQMKNAEKVIAQRDKNGKTMPEPQIKPIKAPVVRELPLPITPQPTSTPPPMRPNKDLELEKMQWAAIGKFMGDRHQNTHINHDERLLLAVIFHDMALNPWSISKRVCEDMNIPFNQKEFEIDILKDFVYDYLDFGIPLDREGRGEVAGIFKAKFEGDKSGSDDKKKDEKAIS